MTVEESELVDGVKRGSMNLLATWVKESDKLLSF